MLDHEEEGGVLEAIKDLSAQIQGLATHMDERFEVVDTRLNKIESTMVTKSYLDDKLADHGSRYGDLIIKTNKKVARLATSLVDEGSLSVEAANDVVSSEPFVGATRFRKK